MRTIIIGDVHGCAKTLSELIRLIKYEAGKDRIVFVGDLIDRGPHIKETLDYVMKLKEEAGELCTVLMGNHEQFVVDVDGEDGPKGKLWDYSEKLNTKAVQSNFRNGGVWYWNGGDKSMKQVFSTSDRQKYIDWIKNLPYYYSSDDAYYVTHAGANKGIDLDDNFTKVWNRDLYHYRGPLVVCGHTPISIPTLFIRQIHKSYKKFDRLYPLPPEGILDIDTGCVFGYTLTAMEIIDDSFRLYSVPNQE